MGTRAAAALARWLAAVAMTSASTAALAQDATRGAALYRALPGSPGVGSCFSCHGEPLNNRNNVLRGATGGALISRTIAAVGAMGYLRQYLGDADLADIAAYLATVAPPAALEVLPEPWPTVDDFGAQAVGTQAPEREVLVRNLQPRSEIAIGSVVSSDPLVFPVQPECPLSLPPLAQCRVRTWFRPHAEAPAEARFDILSPGGQVLRSGRLLGTGAASQPGQLAWAPAVSLVDFERVVVGQTSSRTLVLNNPSSLPVVLTRLRVTGPQALRFGITAACVAAGRIEAGASCEVTRTHTPRAAERAEGWVELTSDAGNAPLLRVQAIGAADGGGGDSSASALPEEATGGGALSTWWVALLLVAAVRLGRWRRP
jgi:mono/diheme cytochrome c family protein